MKKQTLSLESLVVESIKDGIFTIQFNHPHYNNPFNEKLEFAVAESLIKAEKDDEVKVIVLTGGKNRSFSVGGDFNEVKELKGQADVERWIDGIIHLYISSLKTTKPTIAVIDNYAIGIGFQLALTCDWRIGTDRCKFIMPELKHGIACSLGQYMLEKVLGRAFMLEIVYGCKQLSTEKCLEIGLLNKVVPVDNIEKETYKLAEYLADYPRVAIEKTKKIINSSYIEELMEIVEKTKAAHKQTFQEGSAQKFMKKIVGK